MEELTALIDCPSCGAIFEGRWHDDSMDPEQLDSAPVAGQECPECGEVHVLEYPGWTTFGEAG